MLEAFAAEAGAEDDTADLESVVLDVSRLSLAELALVDESVLTHTLQRLRSAVDSSSVPVAGFNSAI